MRVRRQRSLFARAGLIATLSLMDCACLPPAASAAVATLAKSADGKTLTYAATGSGAINLFASRTGPIAFFTETNGTIADGDGAGAGNCVVLGDGTTAQCPADTVERIAVTGSPGNDSVQVIATRPVTLSGGAGVDVLRGSQSNGDVIDGGPGNDVLFGVANQPISGGALPADGIDIILGGTGNDQIYAGRGNDYVDAGDGNDDVRGDVGDDTLLGGNGSDLLVGDSPLNGPGGAGDGNDRMSGGPGDDQEVGGLGNDSYSPKDLPLDSGSDGLMDGLPGAVPDGGTNTYTVWGDHSTDYLNCAEAADSVDFVNYAPVRPLPDTLPGDELISGCEAEHVLAYPPSLF